MTVEFSKLCARIIAPDVPELRMDIFYFHPLCMQFILIYILHRLKPPARP